MRRKILFIFLVSLPLFSSSVKGQNTVFAVIGDFGSNDINELNVANMVSGWNPEFIISVGDNVYSDDYSIDVGKYYHYYIYPHDPNYGESGDASSNLFWPAVGNHDWDLNNLSDYTNYFTSPINNRYYSKQIGDIEFIFIDSDTREQDGTDSASTQAHWVHQQIKNSNALWKIIIVHHPPYCSGGSSTYMQWPFEDWGVSAVISGHVHVYERILRDDNNDGTSLIYLIDGLGGAEIANFYSTVEGSIKRYNSDFGAMKVTESASSLQFQFYSVAGGLIDTYENDSPLPVELTSFAANLIGGNIAKLDWSTATEVNNYGFEIDRSSSSSDSSSNYSATGKPWKVIGFVPGAGNSNVSKFYSFVDSNLAPCIYFYRLKQIDNDGKYKYSYTAGVSVEPKSIYILSQNYPNPFNPSTTISYSIPKETEVSIRIYDITGRFVTTIINMLQTAGTHSIRFNASRLNSGIYFCQMKAGEFIQVRKMIILK